MSSGKAASNFPEDMGNSRLVRNRLLRYSKRIPTFKTFKQDQYIAQYQHHQNCSARCYQGNEDSGNKENIFLKMMRENIPPEDAISQSQEYP